MKVFITGASDGIGKELAKQLAADGHQVWGIARRRELLEKLQSDIGAEKFYFSVCDVGNEAESQLILKKMKEKGFLPDAVILNAAAFLSDADPQYDHSLLVRAFRVNVFGALFWVGAFLPDFLKRGSGKFIAVSSVAAFRPNPKSISLSASKSALSMTFRSLRLRYAVSPVSFQTVYLGPVATAIAPEWQSTSGSPRYPFVMAAAEAAAAVKKAVLRSRADYWVPFFTTLAFRLALFLPDKFFVLASRYFKKK